MTSEHPSLPDPPAPWLTFETQQDMAWRDGDVVISAPLKSGTNWMMNIAYQLETGGDASFRDIYHPVTWIEFLPGPGTSAADLTARIDAMPEGRRSFKSHSPPPLLPYFNPARGGPDVKYLVVMRNPEEVLVSVRPFYEMHRAEFLALWGMEPFGPWPSFEVFFETVAGPAGLIEMVFGFGAGWWPLRHQPNVCMLHFTELKTDLEGSIRKVAAFLGSEPSPAQWSTIVEHCGFAWMKANQLKFELPEIADVPVLASGGMVRRGKLGAAREEGLTEAVAAQIAARGEAVLPDAAARRWIYEGGPFP